MAVSETIVIRCRSKLVELARKGERITYGELAQHIGVFNQSIGRYLDVIYEKEMESGRPDLTVIPHYSQSWLGKFNSRGRHERTIAVNPDNPAHVRDYKEELCGVYRYWGGKPKGELKNWLKN